jgi:hypothetical protein
MRTSLWAVTAAALLAGPARSADDAYDLRGPAPKVKQVLHSKVTVTITDADVTVGMGDQKMTAKQTMTVTNEEEETVLEVKGREITKSRTKVIADRVKTVTDIDGNKETEDETNDLQGEIVLSVKKDGTWTHKLEDADPTDEQKKELAKRDGPESDDDLFPAEKVKVGHTWTVDAAKARSLTGGQMTDVKGKLKQKFLRVEKVGDEECAVVETSGTITGVMKPDVKDDPTPDVTLKITATGWRSLKTGVELKGTFAGTIRIAGKQKLDDAVVEMTLEGKIAGEGTTSLK